jgi:protein-arginine kinase activator protein McsA
MKCKKCQSENLVMRPNAKNPNATELICGDCGTWQKFIGKEEIRLFEIHHQNKPLTAVNIGCEYCAKEKDNTPIMKDIEIGRHHEKGWCIRHHIFVWEKWIYNHTPIKFCPMCGRKFE